MLTASEAEYKKLRRKFDFVLMVSVLSEAIPMRWL